MCMCVYKPNVKNYESSIDPSSLISDDCSTEIQGKARERGLDRASIKRF